MKKRLQRKKQKLELKFIKQNQQVLGEQIEWEQAETESPQTAVRFSFPHGLSASEKLSLLACNKIEQAY